MSGTTRKFTLRELAGGNIDKYWLNVQTQHAAYLEQILDEDDDVLEEDEHIMAVCKKTQFARKQFARKQFARKKLLFFEFFRILMHARPEPGRDGIKILHNCQLGIFHLGEQDIVKATMRKLGGGQWCLQSNGGKKEETRPR